MAEVQPLIGWREPVIVVVEYDVELAQEFVASLLWGIAHYIELQVMAGDD